MYTVTKIEQIDCYKRAETHTSIIYSGQSEQAAYAIAADEWIETLISEDRQEFMSPETISEFKEVCSSEIKNLDYYRSIHNFFEENAGSFWEPEYINQPTFEIEVENTTPTRCNYKAIAKRIDSTISELPDE
ncbi:MAG: hypothetical protein CL429_04780 [Acidimicrobiaceae bacterium]|mgnify:CR=1 FL=1|nr:hypothetical protein [Acidimicrobiaceae bacterium]